MKSILVLLLVLGVVIAGNPFYNDSHIRGNFFECYTDCHWPNVTGWLIGCEINATQNGTESNLVMMGSKQTKFSSHEYYTNGLREDIWCYYNVPVKNVTGTSKKWTYLETNNGNVAPNVTAPTPPPKPAPIGIFNAPGVKGPAKNPINKQAKVVMKKDENKPGKPNEKFVPKQVTTPANVKVTHYTCPTDCPDKTNDSLHLVRCSIIYNFKGKDNLEQIVQVPYLRTSMLDAPFEAHVQGGKINSSETKKYSKVRTKTENGTKVYDEVLVCEYVKQQGALSYAEPQTPDERLGYMKPLGPEDLAKAIKDADESSGAFKHNKSTCIVDGEVLPYGYANHNDTLYEVNDELADWAENCVALEEYDYGLVQLLNLMDESKVLHGLLSHETVEIDAPGFNGCVKFDSRIEEAVSGETACSEFGEETVMLYISEEAIVRLETEDITTVVEEEWGSGIVYDAFGPTGFGKKLGAEIMMIIAKLF